MPTPRATGTVCRRVRKHLDCTRKLSALLGIRENPSLTGTECREQKLGAVGVAHGRKTARAVFGLLIAAPLRNDADNALEIVRC